MAQRQLPLHLSLGGSFIFSVLLGRDTFRMAKIADAQRREGSPTWARSPHQGVVNSVQHREMSLSPSGIFLCTD